MPAPNKDLFTTKRTLTVDAELCTGCALCATACPIHGMIRVDGTAQMAKPERCTFCLMCVRRCPTRAIAVVTEAVGASLFDYSEQPVVAPGQPGERNVFLF